MNKETHVLTRSLQNDKIQIIEKNYSFCFSGGIWDTDDIWLIEEMDDAGERGDMGEVIEEV